MSRTVERLERELRAAGEAFVIARVVWARAPSSGKPGDTAIIRRDGSLVGWIGGACAEPVIVAEAREVLAGGTPRLAFLGSAEEARPDAHVVPMSCTSEGALEIFMEPVVPNPHVVVVGRSPAVEKLARLLDILDWHVTIVDEDGKGGDNFDGLTVVASYADATTRPISAVVVATQGHYDEDALTWALSTDAGFIGLVASPKRAATIASYLTSMDIAQADIDRIRNPMGLDLGAGGQDGIAVSILAQLVAEHNEGRLQAGAVHEMTPAPETAIDPVCGMSVEIATAKFTHEHEGSTVYFCCPACRKLFVDDPGAYASV